MTWKSVTTATLACGCLPNYYRDAAGPKIGDVVKCSYCKHDTVVKITSIKLRTYPRGGRS
jgi:hypothetical protein